MANPFDPITDGDLELIPVDLWWDGICLEDIEGPTDGREEDLDLGWDWEEFLRLQEQEDDDYASDDVAYLDPWDEILFDEEDPDPLDRLFDRYQESFHTNPAAEWVVESLADLVVKDESLMCAVCNEEFLCDETVKELPCRHIYHEHCIRPWLRIRNTCPLCRYALPTDDS